jgi:hypothetical protein
VQQKCTRCPTAIMFHCSAEGDMKDTTVRTNTTGYATFSVQQQCFVTTLRHLKKASNMDCYIRWCLEFGNTSQCSALPHPCWSRKLCSIAVRSDKQCVVFLCCVSIFCSVFIHKVCSTDGARSNFRVILVGICNVTCVCVCVCMYVCMYVK